MTEQRLVAGIPVEGEEPYYSRSSNKPQKTLEEFQELLKAVLALNIFEGIRWHAYTPAFNDGDPCVFTVGEVYFRVPGMDEESGDNEDGFGDMDYDEDVIAVVGSKKWNWQTREYGPYTGPNENVFDIAKAFESPVNEGSFNDVLYDLFGDNVEVTVTPEKILVDSYDPGY